MFHTKFGVTLWEGIFNILWLLAASWINFVSMFKETASFQRCYFGKSGFLPIFKNPSRPFVFILAGKLQNSTGHSSVLFPSSLILGGLNLDSAICIAKQRACSKVTCKQFGNNVALNAIEIISQTSKQQVRDRFPFQVSNKWNIYLNSEYLWYDNFY